MTIDERPQEPECDHPPGDHGDDEHENRGRLRSTGRGGAGNIHRSPTPGPPPDPAGREIFPPQEEDAIYSTGRGGRGNMRSPSREARPIIPPDEQKKFHEHHNEAMRSTGRGGLGNIHRSVSPPSRPTDEYSADTEHKDNVDGSNQDREPSTEINN